MKEDSNLDEVNHLIEEVDSYNQTVGVIISFCNILRSDFSGEAKIGKKMITSDKNLVSPNTEVTPDIVGQIKDYGLISEVKRSTEYLDKYLEQIRKYDDCLTGWPSKKERKHDIAFLIHILHSQNFIDFLKLKILSGELQLTRKLSIIDYTRSSERQEFFIIKKAHGEISHVGLDEALTRGKGVSAEKIISEFATIKFYDSEPPVLLTMVILWEKIFNTLPDSAEFRTARGGRISIKANIEELFRLCKEFFAPKESDVEIPKKSWIRRAMEKFVKIGVAKQLDAGIYQIYYRRVLHGDPLKFFAERIAESERVSKLEDFEK
jgi:hypothetical protein